MGEVQGEMFPFRFKITARIHFESGPNLLRMFVLQSFDIVEFETFNEPTSCS